VGTNTEICAMSGEYEYSVIRHLAPTIYAYNEPTDRLPPPYAVATAASQSAASEQKTTSFSIDASNKK